MFYSIRHNGAEFDMCHTNISCSECLSTAQYDAWRAIAEKAQWKRPEDVKKAHPKASILKGGRVVFNIKGNDYRLIAVVQYVHGVLMIRFFGSHGEYDKIDAETV